MTRAAHAAASNAIAKAKEIAAKTLGGSPASYRVANGRVSGGGGMALARLRRAPSSWAGSSTATSFQRTSTRSPGRQPPRWPARA
jgi:CO/xanthine dehydrogenase Mo-binding subunit